MTDILASARVYLRDVLDWLSEDEIVVEQFPLDLLCLPNASIVAGLWEDSDYRLAEKYFDRLVTGDIAPAVVIWESGSIVDGHHRIWAARKWQRCGGPSTIAAVVLDKAYAVAEANYS